MHTHTHTHTHLSLIHICVLLSETITLHRYGSSEACYPGRQQSAQTLFIAWLIFAESRSVQKSYYFTALPRISLNLLRFQKCVLCVVKCIKLKERAKRRHWVHPTVWCKISKGELNTLFSKLKQMVKVRKSDELLSLLKALSRLIYMDKLYFITEQKNL